MKHIINLTMLLLLPTLLNTNLFPQLYLPPPDLITPEHWQRFSDIPTEFRWKSISGIDYYSIQVTTDVTFENLNSSSDININFWPDTVCVSPQMLLIDTVYFWRVAARATDTIGEWSFKRAFVTGDKDFIYEKINQKVDVSVVPMPIQNQAEVRINAKSKFIDNFIPHSKLQIFVFDVSGQLINKLAEIDSEQMTNSGVLCDFSDFSTGIYTLFFINDKSQIIAVKEIIIQR